MSIIYQLHIPMWLLARVANPRARVGIGLKPLPYNVTQMIMMIVYLPRNEEGAQNPTVTGLANNLVSYIRAS